MSERYTPRTDQVRAVYVLDSEAPEATGEAFDRWLALHDAFVRMEGHQDGYESARQDMLSGAFVGGPTYEALRNSFTGKRIAAEAVAACGSSRAD